MFLNQSFLLENRLFGAQAGPGAQPGVAGLGQTFGSYGSQQAPSRQPGRLPAGSRHMQAPAGSQQL